MSFMKLRILSSLKGLPAMPYTTDGRTDEQW